jgi:hypothetical protein
MLYNHQLIVRRKDGNDTIIPCKSRAEVDWNVGVAQADPDVTKIIIRQRATVFSNWREVDKWERPVSMREKSNRTLELVRLMARDQYNFYNRVCDAVENAAAEHNLQPEAVQDIINAISDEFRKG